MSSPPPGFALIVGKSKERRANFAEWAENLGGRKLFRLPTCLAYGFGGSAQGPIGWSDETVAGCFLGEVRASEDAEPLADWQQGAAAAATLRTGTTDKFQLGDLEGLYCCAAWDEALHKLTLFRDSSCARSLYWTRKDGHLAVATQLALLVSQPCIPKEIKQFGLHEYLRFLDISPTNTIYAGVHAIEPGAPVQFPADNETLTRKDGAKAPDPSSSGPCSFDAAVDVLDIALQHSVESRLNRGKLTGISLSGGVDSALICAIGARLAPERVAAFTLGFDNRGLDESPIASSIAKHLGIPHHRIAYDLATYAERFHEFVARIDLPFADPAGLPTLMLFEEVKQSTDLLLDGTGADTLAGIMPARHTRIATQYIAPWPRSIRRLFGNVLAHIPVLSAYAPLWDFDTPEDLLIRWKGWTRKEIEALCQTHVTLEQTRFFRLYRGFPRHMHFERYSVLIGNLPDDRVHQAAELTGLTVRFPYWDSQVENAMKNLPRSFQFNKEEPKRLLRALLARYVPREVWEQPKHGFDFPFRELMRHDNHALIRRHLEDSKVREFGLVDDAMVARHVDAFIDGDDHLAFRIWALVVLFAWLEHHLTPVRQV